MIDDLDKFFEELEEMADKAEVERLRNKPLPQSDLDRKILDDFHGHAPNIDESFNGKLPTITPKIITWKTIPKVLNTKKVPPTFLEPFYKNVKNCQILTTALLSVHQATWLPVPL